MGGQSIGNILVAFVILEYIPCENQKDVTKRATKIREMQDNKIIDWELAFQEIKLVQQQPPRSM